MSAIFRMGKHMAKAKSSMRMALAIEVPLRLTRPMDKVSLQIP